MKTIESKSLDPKFKHDVAAHAGGENIKLCFACGTCTAACPVAEVDSEFNPRKIIRQVLLGMRKETLASPVIWRCVQCYSCTAKCPQNVRFREVIRALREMAVAEGVVDAAMAEEVESIGPFLQKVRRNLVANLLADRDKYEESKKKLSELAG
jgi:heterodisulfide reductase subunit C2